MPLIPMPHLSQWQKNWMSTIIIPAELAGMVIKDYLYFSTRGSLMGPLQLRP